MPLTRYRIKNEYGLADPEVYRSADKDDPEALLEGVAMAGLVGLLRQLGDLAEFAAEIFHDLHEEVMATSARGHGLMVRIQQLEAEFPPVEKALLLQTNPSLYYFNAGVEWHPNLQMEQNLISQGDLPRFVMDSYEESRGAPRLFLLDKFDVAGAGACLKRYTDPSFFKVETVPDNLPTVEVQREKKVRKTKKKGVRWRNGETPETVTASHAKLHQLFMEERIENAYNDPARRVKLKKRPLHGSPFDSKSEKSYMDKFVESPSPESKTICEVSVIPSSLKWTQDATSESGLEVVEVSTTSPVKDVLLTDGRDVISHNIRGKPFMDDVENLEPTISGGTDEVSSISHAAVDEKELTVNEDGNREGSMDGYLSDEMTSEVENYLDALATIESEMETDNDSRHRHNMNLSVAKGERISDANEDMKLHTETLASQSVENSASNDWNSFFSRSSNSLSSERLSNMGDSIQFGSDSFSKALPPHESTVTDSRNLPDDQLLHEKEALGSKEHTLFAGKSIEDDAICDLKEVSQTSSSADLESTCTPMNTGSRSCVGSEQDEKSSDCMKHASGLSDSDETRENLVDSFSPDSDDVPNQTKGNNLATISTRYLSADELEDGHLNVCSMNMEHLSDNLELTSGSESRNEVPNTGDVAESCNGISLRMDSPQSTLPLEEQHHFSRHPGEDGPADHTFSSASFPPDSSSVQASSAGNEVDDAILASVDELEMSTVLAEEQQFRVNDQMLINGAVNEGNLSDLDLQHKVGDEISLTLVGEDIDSLTQNEDAGGKPGDPFCPDMPIAGTVVGSNSGDLMLMRVNLEDISAIKDESQVLVEEQKSLVETEKVTLDEENLPEVDTKNQERSCKEVSQDEENTDNLIRNFEAVDGATVSLAPSGGDNDSVLDELVTREVQAGATKVTLDEENLPEVDTKNQERSCKEVSQDEENTDSLIRNFKAVDGATDSLAPLGGDDSVLDELVTREVQAGAGNSEASVADIGLVPQERVDLYEAESPGWMKESGVEEKVNVVEVAQDLDSVSTAGWDSVAHGDSNTAMGVCGSFQFEQTKSGFSNDIRTTSISLDQGNANHARLKMENPISSESGLLAGSMAASEKPSKLLVDDPAVDLHLADDGIIKSLNLQGKRVPSMDLLDHETVFLPRSEAALEYGSGMQDEVNDTKFQQVTVASHFIGCQDEEMQSLNSLNLEKHEGYSVNLLENFSIQQPSLTESLQGPMFDTRLHKFVVLSEGGEVSMSEMPPMPPLPPVQWRMGKTQNIPSTDERKYLGFGQGLLPPLQTSLAKENPQIGFPAFEAGAPLSKRPFLSPVCSDSENPAQTYPCALQMQPVDSDSVVHSKDMNIKPLSASLSQEHTIYKLPEQYSFASETKWVQDPPLPQSVGDITSEQHPGSPAGELAHPADWFSPKTDTEVKDLQHSTQNADGEDCSDLTNTRQEQENPLNSKEEIVRSTDPWALPPPNEGGKPNGILVGNIPRPPKPLIEAVAAHDRSKLKKVAERVRPQLAPKLEERDSLLEQIRTKSFNLKSASVARPGIQQAPKTNLKVAAILEKANAIRQALAGSDEDDDADSWSE